MSDRNHTPSDALPTGVPGLDAVLGGGLPEYSFNLIAGAAGAGKTTLVQQIMFNMASPECPALYVTVLGEPPLKMLRYQQRFAFFSREKLAHIRFINLTQEALDGDLEVLLQGIVREVEEVAPRLLVVDSFRSIMRKASQSTAIVEMESFVQRLAVHLSAWEATTFLVGEYPEREMQDNAVFTVADGILALQQSVERNSTVRKLQVVKMRGQAQQPGLHTFRISSAGVQVFPRSYGMEEKSPRKRPIPRTSTGVPGLDEMMNGGIPVGDSALVAGPAGSGKSLLCTQFITEGARRGEPGVIAVFEEHPEEYVARADDFGLGLGEMVRAGQVRVIYLRPLDLSVDETLREVRDAVDALGARRVVVDSLSGFELALAPGFRTDFRESMYRMVGSLTGIGVTVLTTVEVTNAYQELRFSPHHISFLTDDIILQRYVELEGQLRKLITVVKMRSGEHSKDLRLYDITAGQGLVVGERLRQYQGLLSGVAVLRDPAGTPSAGPDATSASRAAGPD